MNPHARKGACYLAMGKLTNPPAEELDIPAAASGEQTALLAGEPHVQAAALGEPATSLTWEPDVHPTPQETDKKKEAALTCEFPSWMEIHPSCLVTPVGQVPPSLGNVSSATRFIFQAGGGHRHHGAEEQRMSEQGDSSLTLLCESPMPDPTPKGYSMKVLQSQASGRLPSL